MIMSPDDLSGLLQLGILRGDLEKVKPVASPATINRHFASVRVYGLSEPLTNVSPLYLAVHQKHDDIAAFLLGLGANPVEDINGTDTPLHCAAASYMPKTMQAMADLGVDLNTPGPLGLTALDVACDQDNVKGGMQLLALGASPNQFSPMRSPPLFRFNTVEGSAQALLDAGADLSVHNRQGKTIFEEKLIHWREFYERHREALTEKLHCEPGAGAPGFALVKQGKPTTMLKHICSAGLLQELFSEARWKGREAEGLKLYETLAPAIPDYYQAAYANLDLTALRRAIEAPAADMSSAVGRYVRKPKTTPSEGRQ